LLWGYQLTKTANHNFFISDPEKTLLDYLYINSHLKNSKDFIELRINRNNLKQLLDLNKLRIYLEDFSNSRLNKAVSKLLEVYNVKF